MIIRAVLVAAAAVLVPPLACAAGFDVKTGSWEIKMVTHISGMPIPKSVLEGMPPAQRARMEAAMAARADNAQPHTVTSCVTQKDLDRGRLMKSDDANCTRKVIAQSARHMEMEETCTGSEPSKTHSNFEAASAERYTAVIDRMQGEGGKVRVEMSGRWLGSACKKGD